MSGCVYPATTPQKKLLFSWEKAQLGSRGAQANRHCTSLVSDCTGTYTVPADERNLIDLNDDCVFPALPLANRAAQGPVTALTTQPQCQSRSTSQRLTSNPATWKGSQSKRGRKSDMRVQDVTLSKPELGGQGSRLHFFGEGNFEITT